MSVYELNRVQESRAWVEGVKDLPPAAVGSKLIDRAYTIVEGLEEGSYRGMVAQRLSFIFDPVAGEEYRTEKAAAAVVRGAEELLEDEADVAGMMQEFLWNETQRDDVDEEEDYFADERRAEHLAKGARSRSLGKLARIGEIVATAEFGVNFGEAPGGRQWSAVDTIDSIRTAMMMQDELSMPIESDRLRELIIHGLDELHDVIAVDFLVKIANQAQDRAAFMVAGERYGRAIDARKNIFGDLQSRVIQVATKRVESGDLDPSIIDTALKAIAHSDPVTLTYPFNCARLGLALQGVAQKS